MGDSLSTNFNDSVPAAPANNTNVKWQTDGSGNDSAYVPTPFLVETDVIITSLIPGDILVWNGSNWVNAFPIFPANTPAVAGQALTGYDDTTGLFTQASVGATVNPQTVSYAALLTDANNVVTMAAGGANTFTVPKDGTVNFPIGTTLTVTQIGTGQVTLTPEDGTITINTSSSLTTRAQWSIVSVVKYASNLWVAGGDLT